MSNPSGPPNPYQSPGPFSDQPGGNISQQQAPSPDVMTPAIVNMVFTILGILLIGLDLAVRMFNIATENFKLPANPPPGHVEGFYVGLYGSAIIEIVSLFVGFYICYAMIFMMNRRRYQMVRTAMILSVIPCINPCCLVGNGIAIWGLTVVNNPATRASFKD